MYIVQDVLQRLDIMVLGIIMIRSTDAKSVKETLTLLLLIQLQSARISCNVQRIETLPGTIRENILRQGTQLIILLIFVNSASTASET